MAKIQMQWFWNFHLEEPEGNKWDEVERRRTLFKRERAKSVVFTAKEPEKISNDYCAGVDGDNDGDVYGSGGRYPIWFNSMFEFCQKMIHSILLNIALPKIQFKILFNSKKILLIQFKR